MFARTVSTLALALIYAAAATAATAIPRQPTTAQLEARSVPADARVALPKRCSGCSYVGCGGCGGCGCCGRYGGYGGYGGYGFPFVSSFTNEFDRNSNRANYNENTLYANNVNANAASDNVHAFTNANVIA